MIYTAVGKCESYGFSVITPIFTPYYNIWGQNAYWQSGAFAHDPFNHDAVSTSGSPVIIAGNKIFAFMNRCGGTFNFDGKTTLTVTLAPGQELFVDECCDPWSKIAEYNAKILGDTEYTPQPFWSDLEYCTWVEQSRAAQCSRSNNYDVFNEAFVYDYMKRIEKLGLPKHGKLTIDDGWAIVRNERGQYLVGDWEIDRNRFPNFEKMISDIASEGFMPGLWLTPFQLSPDSRFGKEHPELISSQIFGENRPYIRYAPEYEQILHEYYRNIFTPYVQLGIKKFKLDISYGRKSEMIELLRIIREEIKKLDDTIELESHIPDVFAAKYADTIRMNDVSIFPNINWQNVVTGHFQVCHYSSDRIINLDHMGGNNPMVNAAAFLDHCDMLLTYSRMHKSYPVISILPDHFSKNIRDEFSARVREFGY